MNTSHHSPFSQHPLAQVALFYSAGILTSLYLATRLWLVVTCCAISSAACVLLVIGNRLSLAGAALLVAVFFSGGALLALESRNQHTSRLKNLLAAQHLEADKMVVLTGIVAQQPVVARGRIFFTLEVESVTISGLELQADGPVSLLLLAPDQEAEEAYRHLHMEYGARIRAKVTLSWTDKYRNPGVSTLTEYLERKGYEATGLVKTPKLISRLNEPPAFRPLAWLYEWRDGLQSRIDSLFSPDTAGVLDAALLGNRYNLSHATSERFRAGGTFHVLVISGLHVSFLAGVVLLLVKSLTRNRLLQFSLSNTIVWGYALAVGAEASVLRAALMCSFVTFSAVVFRPASSLNALGGAAMVLLVWSPRDIFDPSLQLTFLSVLSIVVVAWPLLKNLHSIGSWRPTRSSPYPPSCSRAMKVLSETLFWSERKWSRELGRSTHDYHLFKTPVASWLERIRLQSCARYMFSAVVVSSSVQLLLLPLLIIYFHRISFSSLVLNILVSVILTVLVAVSLMALLVSLLSSSLALPLVHCANGINWLMVHSVDPFSRLGVASLRLPEYSGWARSIYVLYFLPLLALGFALHNWEPLALPKTSKLKRKINVDACLVAQAVLVLVIVLHPLSAPRADGKLHLDFLDVGQGDSILVTTPDGTTLLVDGGGRPNFLNRSSTTRDDTTEGFERETRSIGESVVSEYLWGRGLSTVDFVLATHADADHIDGLNDVVQNFFVRSALVGRTPMNDGEYARFAQTLSVTRTPVNVIQGGDKLTMGGLEIEVLWPPPLADPHATSRNNDSVVLRLNFGRRKILLTGDIEKQSENSLVNSSGSLQSDVVKVPHHGSRTSSTEAFVTATRASVAIISVGQTSMFGHPHREVLERWQAHNVDVLTTGKCGTIAVTSDGDTVWISTFLSRNQ